MTKHVEHADVQMQVCMTLRHLACNVASKTAIVAAGVIPVLLTSMRAHRGQAEVQEQGCWLLAN